MTTLALILCILALWMITPDAEGEEEVRRFLGQDGVNEYRSAQAIHALVVALIAFAMG